ncbi:MAG: ferredoxin [Segniliparus sp.]|uniref:ferredoxin n=1 Tax=Segniliparus sp. TaxID=2804064 RepID=UPI003F309AD6
MADKYEVSVDQDLCMGSGYCLHENSKLFSFNDDGIAEVLGGEPPAPAGAGPILLRADQVEAARKAEAVCPSSAISLSKRA